MRFLKQFLLFFCIGLVCVLFPFLCLSNFPYGPFSFGSTKIGDFTSLGNSAIFNSNKFFNGIFFVFGNLRDENLKIHVKVVRVSDGRKFFDEVVDFSNSKEAPNYLEKTRAKPISFYGKESIEIQKIFKILNYKDDQQKLCNVKSFQIFIPNGELKRSKHEIFVNYDSGIDPFDFAFYAPYFLVY